MLKHRFLFPSDLLCPKQMLMTENQLYHRLAQVSLLLFYCQSYVLQLSLSATLDPILRLSISKKWAVKESLERCQLRKRRVSFPESGL